MPTTTAPPTKRTAKKKAQAPIDTDSGHEPHSDPVPPDSAAGDAAAHEPPHVHAFPEMLTELGREYLAKMQEIVADRDKLLEAAEEVLCANSGDRLPGRQPWGEAGYALVLIACLTDERLINDILKMRQIREPWSRAARASSLIRLAGTRRELEDAIAQRDSLDRQCGELREAIAAATDRAERQELREKLRSLEAERGQVGQRIAKMEQARTDLRDYQPPFAVDRARTVLQSDEYRQLMQKIADMEHRIGRVQTIGGLRLDRDADLLVAVNIARKVLDGSHAAYPVHNRTFGRWEIDRQAWADFVEDEQADEPLMREELANLKAEQREMEASAIEPVSWHARKFGL